jgi:rhamnulokinase
MTDSSLRYEVVHRFPNGPVHREGHLHWDVAGLFQEILSGIAHSHGSGGSPLSIGIDSWAVDYGLVHGGDLVSEPFHYRDSRSDSGVAAIHQRKPFEELFAINGLQFLPFTTLYQLGAEDFSGVAGSADNLLLIPDLFAYWLTGVVTTELTNASTTGLVAVGTDSWNEELISITGAPRRLFGDLVAPGTTIGGVTGAARDILGQVPVVAVGSHDTASAVAATPLRGADSAYISLGTWGLVGLEVPRPILSDDARRENFTNERAVDGQVRFLRNVMGMWIVNESVTHWQKTHPELSLDDLISQARHLPPPRDLVDVNDPVFMAPGDMPNRISQWLAQRDYENPASPADVVNMLLSSLAQAYVDTVHQAGALAGVAVKEINIVGGGSQNPVLCQRIADMSEMNVVAGPVEATAIGNLLVQAHAHGLISGGGDMMRHVVRASSTLTTYHPSTRQSS